jgi:protein gp37
MGTNSKIEWTTHTWNPWRGCEHATLADGSDHPGCLHCYAETMSKRNPGTLGVWGPEGPRVRGTESYLRWNEDAMERRVRERIFCSLMDPFEEYAGPIRNPRGERAYVMPGGSWLFTEDCEELERKGIRPATMTDLRERDLFPTIDHCPGLDFLLLTKRPQNVRRFWPAKPGGYHSDAEARDGQRRDNVWLLYSASDQRSLDSGVGDLAACRHLVPVLGLSLEPMVGPMDLKRLMPASIGTGECDFCGAENVPLRDASCPPSVAGAAACFKCLPSLIDWVIVGGESGTHARPLHPDWVRSVRDQCLAAGVPFFFKQWGEWKPISEMTQAEWEPYYVSNRKAGPHQDQDALDDVYGRRCTIPTQTIRFDGQAGNGLSLLEAVEGHWAYMTFRVGKEAAGCMLDCREWSEFPAVEFAHA